jgi:hypothetical protein
MGNDMRTVLCVESAVHETHSTPQRLRTLLKPVPRLHGCRRDELTRANDNRAEAFRVTRVLRGVLQMPCGYARR